MKTRKIGFWLAGSVVAGLLVAFGLFALQPTASAAPSPQGDAQATLTVITDADQARQRQVEAAYAEQLTQVQQALAERKAVYDGQLQEMNNRVATGQTQVRALADQEQAIQQQIAQLYNARLERQAAYATQLAAARQEYDQRLAQLAAQLQEAQARLAEARTLLGQ